MNARFCPDCGEECASNARQCQECGFPLQLTTIGHGDYVTIPKAELPHWNRIVQILRRNSVTVESRPASSWSSHQAWWALPMIGFLVLVSTVFFGGNLVNLIWPAPEEAIPVLDLNAPPGQSGVSETTGVDTTADDLDFDEDETDTSFLQSALKTSDEQMVVPEDQVENYDQFLDLPEASADEIADHMAQGVLEVSVKQTMRRGTLLGADGYFIAETTLLENAFQNDVRTITSRGSLVQENVYVVPLAGRPGENTQPASLIVDGPALGLSLLSAPIDADFDYELNFDADLVEGQEVWVASYYEGRFYPEKTTVTGSVANAQNVLFWTLEKDLGIGYGGAPVFNPDGKLGGVLLYFQGAPVVCSLYRLRDKAPMIFKELQP